ncbi:hypothetical protein [Selenomonas sp. KH1T6]|uniref:hypothetical protein n=1 Tax=Selenomonas sp. KH1T6 TaxID=3158784 RepID=UPI0008A7E38D|nr:hypothetical protein SAMN05216583_14113 [Selenomonas ruminantium]
MTNNKDNKKDIYIQLLEDLILEDLIAEDIRDGIDPYTPILQNAEELANAEDKPKKIDTALKNICAATKEQLKCKEEMLVGCPDEDDFGYIEPCPIQYTGNLKKGDKFENVFMGLNPFLEDWRKEPRFFPKNTSFADLANYHHPDDIRNIRNGRSADYYSGFNNNDDILHNNYWRVLGHKEGKSTSPYYQDIITLHLALLRGTSSKHIKWTELINLIKRDNEKNITKYLLQTLQKYPIANIEMIPFKTSHYEFGCFSDLLTGSNELSSRYSRYINHVFEFINNHAASDAYILITTNLKGSDPLTDVFNVVSEQIKKMGGNCNGRCFLYSKDKKTTNCFTPGSPSERKSYQLAPMYLANWSDRTSICRKIIITPSISKASPHYTWIFNPSCNWVDAIKKHWPI